jgi:hypothetical protein
MNKLKVSLRKKPCHPKSKPVRRQTIIKIRAAFEGSKNGEPSREGYTGLKTAALEICGPSTKREQRAEGLSWLMNWLHDFSKRIMKGYANRGVGCYLSKIRLYWPLRLCAENESKLCVGGDLHRDPIVLLCTGKESKPCVYLAFQ